MKRLIAASVAALLFTACSESTAPVASNDLAVSYGKKVTPPPTTVAGAVTNAFFDFSGASVVAAAGVGGVGTVNGAIIDTDTFEGVNIASPVSPIPTYTQPTNFFVGRFANTQTAVLLTVPNGGAKYALEFDFYAIGSWDGIGKQAQNGAFLANVFQVGAVCTGDDAGTIRDIFTSTFSNQMTVQQNYPLAFGTGGGAKALTGSVDSGNLFNGDPTVNVPVFRSVSDATYHMSFTGVNPCVTGTVTFVFRTFAPGQQSAPDETWGVDNISIKTDN
jgi:hypothetical protein